MNEKSEQAEGKSERRRLGERRKPGAGPWMGEHDFAPRLSRRHRIGNIWRMVFRASTVVGILALGLLLVNIVNDAFGYVAVVNTVDPLELGEGQALEDLPKETLVQILEANVSAGLFRRFAHDEPFEERPTGDVINLVYENVVKPRVVNQWTLLESLTQRRTILTQGPVDYPGASERSVRVRFESWVDVAFVTSPQSADATRAGIRTAILGSLWTIAIAILFAFPIGVGAAIYLEEYAADAPAGWRASLNHLIQTNINNLAGVPSIIYGILGLAIFVRVLQPLTSGAVFGVVDPTTANGRTIISAGMTLGLLILPLIIINAQEAIKAVPNSLREAALGLGATRWQTVWGHVLPNAMSGILTGAILAVSRAIGETAPLVVVGASTYITADPNGPFAKFTTLPIQIFQWTTRPQSVFRNIAAAAIVILLVLLLSMNGAAILLRNRFSKRL